ncbi:MAG: hypothetical protein IPL90_04110 [Holophagales bacterium]|nr:hypothetical protein [Holophagales bacterium]
MTRRSPVRTATGGGRRGALLLLAIASVSCRVAPKSQAEPPAPAPPPVRIEYLKPTDRAHQVLFEDMRDRRVLEQLAEVLAVVRLPRPLTLRFAGCDGTSNAWYEPEDGSVTFCYEYLADLRKAAVAGKPGRVTLQEAIDGPTVFVLLHETGHAVFDLLDVPILGREEDAADAFAAITLLRLGKGVALRMLRGAAWSYFHEAHSRKMDESDYADVHGLDSQRYYNILCMAYGSDPDYFAAAVKDGRLPPERAEGCVDEYLQAVFAMQKLVAPAVDRTAMERLRVKHSKRFSAGAR